MTKKPILQTSNYRIYSLTEADKSSTLPLDLLFVKQDQHKPRKEFISQKAHSPWKKIQFIAHVMKHALLSVFNGRKAAMQTQFYLIRGKKINILLDCGWGNHKNIDGPLFAAANQLDTPFLDQLKSCGVTPDDIDWVCITHLHIDHVGWMTSHTKEGWQPTFPKAKYVFSQKEYQSLEAMDKHGIYNPGVDNAFRESIRPIVEHKKQLWIEDLSGTNCPLRAESAPGHSLDHHIYHLEEDDPIVFTGDLFHNAVQIPSPDTVTVFDEDPIQSSMTRERVFSQIANKNITVCSCHEEKPLQITEKDGVYNYTTTLQSMKSEKKAA